MGLYYRNLTHSSISIPSQIKKYINTYHFKMSTYPKCKHEDCNKIVKAIGSKHCKEHRCQYSDCLKGIAPGNRMYCDEHGSSKKSSSSTSSSSTTEREKCEFPGCHNPKGYKKVKYCDVHSEKKKRKNGDVVKSKPKKTIKKKQHKSKPKKDDEAAQFYNNVYMDPKVQGMLCAMRVIMEERYKNKHKRGRSKWVRIEESSSDESSSGEDYCSTCDESSSLSGSDDDPLPSFYQFDD